MAETVRLPGPRAPAATAIQGGTAGTVLSDDRRWTFSGRNRERGGDHVVTAPSTDGERIFVMCSNSSTISGFAHRFFHTLAGFWRKLQLLVFRVRYVEFLPLEHGTGPCPTRRRKGKAVKPRNGLPDQRAVFVGPRPAFCRQVQRCSWHFLGTFEVVLPLDVAVGCLQGVSSVAHPGCADHHGSRKAMVHVRAGPRARRALTLIDRGLGSIVEYDRPSGTQKGNMCFGHVPWAAGPHVPGDRVRPTV